MIFDDDDIFIYRWRVLMILLFIIDYADNYYSVIIDDDINDDIVWLMIGVYFNWPWRWRKFIRGIQVMMMRKAFAIVDNNASSDDDLFW